MANSKKRKKILIFTVILVVIAGLSAFAIFRKREIVITIQTDKVARRTLTELVRANGRIQPVVQVKISPEVSGEITELPVKEGQQVKKGDLILKIKPDNYIAARNQTEASYKGSVANKATSEANLIKAEAEFKRIEGLFKAKLVSESSYDEVRAGYAVAKAQVLSSEHQVENAKASLARADEELAKTTIFSPITGTISKLNSELGERVVGTAMMAGSDVMTIADLNRMEARVDIGETDVILIKIGQTVRLEVDAFKDRKFNGEVTQIANSSRNSALGGGSSQEATKFEVRIRVKDNESFRPGMSVTAEIETRSRTNALTVPIASVTTRAPKEEGKTNKLAATSSTSDKKKDVAPAGNSPTTPATGSTNSVSGRKSKEAVKPLEIVFVLDADRVKMAPVKIGISDDEYWEITEGLQEGQEVISGTYRAISRDLEDGKKVKKGVAPKDKPEEAKTGS